MSAFDCRRLHCRRTDRPLSARRIYSNPPPLYAPSPLKVHAEDQDDIETILKLFDLNSECVSHVPLTAIHIDSSETEPTRVLPMSGRYGPAAGMTRLDRWKRAAAWGLEPPTEVWEILSSIEGDKETRYRESLFVGQI